MDLDITKFTRKLVTNDEEFDEMLKVISSSNKISFDTENNGLNPKFLIPAGFSISHNGVDSWYVVINHTDLKTNLHKRFNELLKGKELIIMWNSVYDSGVIEKHYNTSILNSNWYDGMIAQHLLDENNSKGLKQNTEKYFGIKQSKLSETLGGGINPCAVPSTQIYEYACDDAIYTFQHYLRQKEDLKNEGLASLMMNIEMPFQKALLHVRLNGIKFNVDKCKQFEKDLEIKKEEIISNIIESTPNIKVQMDLFGNKNLAVNIDSNKELISLLYDKLNLPVNNSTDKGVAQVDTPSLKKLKNENGEYLHPIIPLLIEYKETGKLLSAYTHSLYDKVESDGRIYSDLLGHGTRTGRLSSRNPNFQQLSKGTVRSFFVASEGYKMYVPDFSQEEYRFCGAITNCRNFINVYEEGKDLHLTTANACFHLGINPEDLIETSPNYNDLCEKFEKSRKKAKFVNFGILFGMGAKALCELIDTSEEEAQSVIDAYFNANPEIESAIKTTQYESKTKGFTRNYFGRKRRFLKDDKGNYHYSAMKQCFNFKIQGGCSDVLRIVMYNLYKYIQTQEKEEIRMLTTVHDEIMFEIKENERFDIHIDKINKIMENSVELKIKLTVSGNVGYNYMDCK